MRVTELNSEELYQLKESLYYGTDEPIELTDQQRQIIYCAICSDAIPDSLVHEAYKDIDFVKEDFFCNV